VKEGTLKFAGTRPRGLGLLERKVAKLGSVVLFEAPSQRGYIMTCYSLAALAFLWTVDQALIIGDERTQRPRYFQALMGGICIIMSAFGTRIITHTFGLIKTVTAVNLNGKMYLRFSVRRRIPFRKPWQFDVSPRQVVFSRRLVVDPNRVTSEGQLQALDHKRISEISFFKAPLKKLNYSFFRLFLSVRQVFTQEDFILLDVEGHKGSLRMDSNGFVSNDLLLLGNPVSVEYS